ncbi:MAG: hypothetical protein DCE88_06795 [Betaproteobacteria bacterium]|jgi:hypothetical protein|nr:MAG: hypothetical protein DCE89_09455 [Betaproteobacteria bacterium]PZO29842.1 MAG: hypothetical protein DCE88_06795 [Betaproteobacteria bacterium]
MVATWHEISLISTCFTLLETLTWWQGQVVHHKNLQPRSEADLLVKRRAFNAHVGSAMVHVKAGNAP